VKINVKNWKGDKKMGKIRKKYEAALKARIALEAVKGEKTIREISSEYGVHPNQIMKWKQQLLKELPSIFSEDRAKEERGKEDLEIPVLSMIIFSDKSGKWDKKVV
jgi:putative transposase